MEIDICEDLRDVVSQLEMGKITEETAVEVLENIVEWYKEEIDFSLNKKGE